MSVLRRAGFKGQALKTAWAIAMRESGGRADAFNGNAGTGDKSYGLFQINMLGSMGPARQKQYHLKSYDALFNPDVNARVAFLMSNGGKDFGAWGIGPHAYKHTSIAAQLKNFPGVPAGPVEPAAPQKPSQGRTEAPAQEFSPPPQSFAAPDLESVGGGFTGKPVDALPGLPQLDQVNIVEPHVEKAFKQVVPHTPDGKPYTPKPHEIKAHIGGTVNGSWKYPQMITGTPSHWSNLQFAGHADSVHVDTVLLTKMNQIARALGVKIDVISGYRSPNYSSSVGGYSNDPHARGVAVDAYINGKPIGDYPQAVALMKRLGLETGAQPNFYHGKSDPEHVQIPGSGINKKIHARHTLK